LLAVWRVSPWADEAESCECTAATAALSVRADPWPEPCGDADEGEPCDVNV